jgi:hypothetical protein
VVIEWLGLISLCLGLVATVASGVSWLSGRTRKAYAAERDFAHIREGQRTIASEVVKVAEAVDRLEDEVRDMKRVIEYGAKGKPN